MTVFGGYRTVWLIVMFDLPTDTAKARRAYMQFRKELLTDGFLMMQYSVYMRHCASQENAAVHQQRIVKSLPSDGQVRIVMITDKQFSRIKTFYGKTREDTEKPPPSIDFL